MQSRWLRPVSIGVVSLIVAVSVFGCFAMRSFVRSDQNRILKERGSAVAVLLQSVFQQELASIKVLGEVAQVNRADASADFAAGAQALINQSGVSTIGLATPTHDGFVLKALVGGTARSGSAITGQQAALIQRGARSFNGATLMMMLGKTRTLGVALPVNKDVVFVESAIPSTPLSSVAPPFNDLRGTLYASRTPDPSQVMMTTEKHLPMTGNVQTAKFLVGDYEWTMQYSSNGPLVGTLTAAMPWLFLGVGLFLALLVESMFFLQGRRRAFADNLVQQRTASLAKANSELDEARIFLRHLVSSGPIVVAVIDADTLTASYVSSNITRVFGFSENEALSPGLFEQCVAEPHLSEIRTAIDDVAGASPDAYVTLEFPVQLGTESRWISAVFVAAGRHAENRSVLVYALDIDEQHRAADVKEAAQKAAHAANRSKSEFLSRMSHELRTPLNAILGYAQLFEMTEPREDQREPVQQMLASGRHLLDMINEILDISRIESGTLSLSVEPVSVGDVVQTAIDMMRPAADDAGVALTLREGCTDRIVLADLQRLRQILLNLVSNAVKYNHRGGNVSFGCEAREGNMVRISVTDDGPGISSDHHELVFAPFERLDADRTEVEGSGMGLALCRRLTEAMGGAIGLDSAVGRGSTFWIELPAAQGAEQPQLVIADAPLVPEQRAPAERTVLLVEDNPANVRLVERIFRTTTGVRVTATTFGRTAVDTAVREHADLVLLDLNLPDMSGERVLAALRSEPRTRDIPVVIISADATSGQIDRLLAAGAERYLTKPFDVEELLEVVGSLAGAK